MAQLGYRHPDDPVPAKLSDLIAQLQAVQAEHGDLEILYRDMTWGEGTATTHRLVQGCRMHEVIDLDDRQVKWTAIAKLAKTGQQFAIFDTNGVF